MRITVAILAIAALFVAPAALSQQATYPTPGTWMADCPTATQAQYIAYHWVPGPNPQSRPWCTVIDLGATHEVYRVDAPLDGIGLSTAFASSNWDSRDPNNVVEITTAAQSQEESALIASLNAWYDARAAAGTVVTRAEFDALATDVATLQTQLATALADLATTQAELATTKGHLAAAGQ
jgi:hypothetical protein